MMQADLRLTAGVVFTTQLVRLSGAPAADASTIKIAQNSRSRTLYQRNFETDSTMGERGRSVEMSRLWGAVEAKVD